jgi:Mg/Co/Ni transporter MgtE
MFQLDDQFLTDIGLGDLPEDQKKPFLQHIYTQLQEKVGVRLSDGLSEEQLTEFESIIDRKEETVSAWIAQYAPDYQNDELLQRMSQQTRLAVDDPSLKAEYAATKWLEVNRPDYKDVVAVTLDELKQEIIQNRDAILGNS